MEIIKDRLVKIVEEILEFNDDLFLVDVLVKGGVGNQKLLIFIDGDEGISIDHCSKVSRGVGAILEEEEIIATKYTLEVSSPGLDHPITNKRQYKKNIGRRLEIEKSNGEMVTGELLNVDEESIVLRTNNGTEGQQLMKFSEINKSKIEVSFK